MGEMLCYFYLCIPNSVVECYFKNISVDHLFFFFVLLISILYSFFYWIGVLDDL